MNKVMLLYPPGKLYQRSEDRAQCNLEEAATGAVHACNDLGYCAAVLLKKDYEVFLRDYQSEKVDYEEVKKDVKNFRPDLIVLSTTNSSVNEDLEFLNQIFKINPCIIVVKGALFYDIDLRLLKYLDLKNVSCLIGSEMEFVIGALADYYLRDDGSLSGINGIIYKKNGLFIKNPFVCGLNNLDSLPFPAREHMNNALYVRPDTGETMATISTGLGCPSKCIYCLTPIISGRNVRNRSVESVFKEIEECYYRFGIRNFFFKADTFTIDEEYAIAICDKIIGSELNGKIEFTVNSRVKPLSMRLLKKLKEAGCFMLAVGFESGSDETLKLIKKGTNVADNLMAAKMIKQVGIPLFGFFMLGFPWETKEHVLSTKKLIYQINPDFIELHIAMPYYGTELFDICDSYGVICGNGFGYDYYSPNTTGTCELSTERIERLKRRILLGFYLRPSYILKKMFGALKNPNTVSAYVKYGFRLIRLTLFRKSIIKTKWRNRENKITK